MATFVFDYPPFESDKPLVPVEIRYGDKTRAFYALVDSGADRSVMSREIAESLGIRVSMHDRGLFKKERIRSFTGETNTIIAPVTLTVKQGAEKCVLEDFRFCIPIDRKTKFKLLLGRPQFFERFVVTIDHSSKAVILEEKR